MAEIFVVTADADFAGQYVSDLPVINEAPVSRQVGFYLPSLASAYATELSSYFSDEGANVGAQGDADGLATFVIARALAGETLDEASVTTADGTTADYGTGSVEGVLRILTGASRDTNGNFAETGVVGNGRLIGGKRRLYLRDRTTASLGEGFLRTHSDAGNLVVYLVDGSIA